MKLSEKQAQMLFIILTDSIAIHAPIGFKREDRIKLSQDILNQQSNELKELDIEQV